jgi:hypothetical protein
LALLLGSKDVGNEEMNLAAVHLLLYLMHHNKETQHSVDFMFDDPCCVINHGFHRLGEDHHREPDSDEGPEEELLCYAEERLEDDNELKLHALSNQALWSRSFV